MFKKIIISSTLVTPLESFFVQEMANVDLHEEIPRFRIIWKEQCGRHLIVNNLLLEIGGIQRMKMIVTSVIENLSKHYNTRFSSSSVEDIYILS